MLLRVQFCSSFCRGAVYKYFTRYLNEDKYFFIFKLLIKKHYFMHQDFYGLDYQHYTTRRLVYQRKSDIKRTIVYLKNFFFKLFTKMLT